MLLIEDNSGKNYGGTNGSGKSNGGKYDGGKVQIRDHESSRCPFFPLPFFPP